MKKPGTALGCALLLMLTAAALAADSRRCPRVCRYEPRFASLPPALDGCRIVLLVGFGPDPRRPARLVLAQQPDLIALAGDFGDSPGQLSALAALLSVLRGTAPIVFIGGGHAPPALRRLLDRYGVTKLENRCLPLRWKGVQLILAGAESPAERLRAEHPEGFVLRLDRGGVACAGGRFVLPVSSRPGGSALPRFFKRPTIAVITLRGGA